MLIVQANLFSVLDQLQRMYWSRYICQNNNSFPSCSVKSKLIEINWKCRCLDLAVVHRVVTCGSSATYGKTLTWASWLGTAALGSPRPPGTRISRRRPRPAKMTRTYSQSCNYFIRVKKCFVTCEWFNSVWPHTQRKQRYWNFLSNFLINNLKSIG
jgi:hypothetical protein